MVEEDTELPDVDPPVVEADTKLPEDDPAVVEADTELPVVDPALVEEESETAAVDPPVVEADTKLSEVDPALVEEESEPPAPDPIVRSDNAWVVPVVCSISSWTTVRAWLVISMAVVIETTAVVIELFSASVQVTDDETEEISVARVSTTMPSGKLVAMEITKREDYL